MGNTASRSDGLLAVPETRPGSESSSLESASTGAGQAENNNTSNLENQSTSASIPQPSQSNTNAFYLGTILFGNEHNGLGELFGAPGWPNTRRQIHRPPRLHQTRTVNCTVNLHKETLRLTPVPHDNGHTLYQLQFTFDATVPCLVKVLYAAREKRDECNQLLGYEWFMPSEDAGSEMQVLSLDYPLTGTMQAHYFGAGFGQQYVQPIEECLDPTRYPANFLSYESPSTLYPVIVILQPLFVANESVDRMQKDEAKNSQEISMKETESKTSHKVTSQSVYATLLRCADGSFAIKPVKIKIDYNGTTYVVHDIFGLAQQGEGSRECVVCISEPRDTLVLPCRHLCLCRACAEVLRYQTNKCPICRSVFSSLLKVKLSKRDVEEAEGLSPPKAGGEDDVSLTLNKKKFSKKNETHTTGENQPSTDEQTTSSLLAQS